MNKTKFKYGDNNTLDFVLRINDDDTVWLKIETEDDTLEFDGEKGNLMIASDFESHFEDCEMNMTLAECKIATYSFLVDWDVDKDVAEAIVKELEPWFERYAISEEESTSKKIEELESWIKNSEETIAKEMASIDDYNKQISDLAEKASASTTLVLNLTRRIESLKGRIAELKGDKFVAVEPCYTGGGIYIFTGKLADGTHFLADSSFFDVRILNADPNEVTSDEGKYTEFAMDSTEWQEEHLVRDLKPEDAAEFFKQMLEWIRVNYPEGNYDMGDIDGLMQELR